MENFESGINNKEIIHQLEEEYKESNANFLKSTYERFLNTSFTVSKTVKILSAVVLFEASALLGMGVANKINSLSEKNDGNSLDVNAYAQSKQISRDSLGKDQNIELEEYAKNGLLEKKYNYLMNYYTDIRATLLEVKESKDSIRKDIDRFESKLRELHDLSNDRFADREGSIIFLGKMLENSKRHLLMDIEAESMMEIDLLEIQKTLNSRELLIKAVQEDVKKSFEMYDQQKETLRSWIRSEEYLQRLAHEFKSYEEAKRIQMARLAELEDDYVLVEGELSIPTDTTKGELGALGHYHPENEKTYVTTDNMYTPLGIHEFTHESSDALEHMSRHAIDLYTKSYIPEKDLDQKSIEYYAYPTERDALRKVLDYDLEKLGIKNYGETFTQEHYNKMMEALNNGQLSRDSWEFINMTKPEYFIEIMNTIATTESLVPMNHVPEPGENDSEQTA